MRWIGIAAAAFALAASGQASAGPAPDWSGVYVGGLAGFGFGHSVHVVEDEHLTTDDFAIRGGLLGATAGVNWQVGPLLIGGEADVALASITGSTDGDGANYGCGTVVFECVTTLGPMATARLRAGLVLGPALAYATGGYFVGSITGAIPGDGISGTGSRSGWSWGGGVELALNGGWSAKAEYLHLDYGKFGYDPGLDLYLKASTDVVRFGLNYRLGGR
jgi:outer membrane immunogenic protein